MGHSSVRAYSEYEVRNAFIPPTALKMMRAVQDAEHRWRLHMRSVASGGENAGTGLLGWGRSVLGASRSTLLRQTECNLVVASGGFDHAPATRECMGREVLGTGRIIAADGSACPDGRSEISR